MRSDLTDITIVMDRSGSMVDCQQEAQNGVNQFIKEQRGHDGSAVLSLVQFDTEYEFVHRGVPIEDVPEFTLVPRGMTALLDAVGRAINETGVRLSEMAEEERPGLVVFVIVTDGEENASHEFSKSQVKELIERQSKKYSWQFTFLGANQDAFAEARSMGIPAAASAKYDTQHVGATFHCISRGVSTMRDDAAAGRPVSLRYTDEERGQMA